MTSVNYAKFSHAEQSKPLFTLIAVEVPHKEHKIYCGEQFRR
jgi:hypothetical protein